jgi:hypothetical protein
MNQIETQTAINNKQSIVSPQELLERASIVAKPTKASRSKLAAHIETIRSLRCRQFSYTQIHRFLNENGMKCSYIGLIYFCHKNFNKKN